VNDKDHQVSFALTDEINEITLTIGRTMLIPVNWKGATHNKAS
jgi:hypothetical protein